MGRKKTEISFIEAMRKLHNAGMDTSAAPNRSLPNEDIMLIEERVTHIFGLIEKDNRPANNMLFFVMYDIESNKVRYQVVKYLLKQGCLRVQKSVFLADLPSVTYDVIRNDLAQVQACYENNDSILIVPISTDYLNAMKIIGQKIDIDIITKSKNILFF